MKIKVMMKDPDTLYDTVSDAVHNSVEDMDADEAEAVKEIRIGKIMDLCGKWFKYDEYLTVEIDTEAKTCTVVESK